jgi:hypothetical protein
VVAASKPTGSTPGEDLTEAGCVDAMPTDDQIADLIVDHVSTCDRVDGAGHPTGDIP